MTETGGNDMEHPQSADRIKIPAGRRPAAENVLIIVRTGVLPWILTLLTVAVWFAAGTYVVETVVSWRHVEDTVNTLLKLVLVALASSLFFLAWGEYNFRKVAHFIRPSVFVPTSADEIAHVFQTTEAAVMTAQKSKFMEFCITDGKHVMCDNENRSCFVTKFEGESEGPAPAR